MELGEIVLVVVIGVMAAAALCWVIVAIAVKRAGPGQTARSPGRGQRRGR